MGLETVNMCSAVKRQIKKGKKKPTAKKVLEISHLWAGPEYPPIDALVKRFEKKHAPIKVRQNVMDWWTYKESIKRRMTEIPPDVIVCNIGDMLTRFAGNDQLTNLTDMWEKQELFDVFPEWMKEKCNFRGRMYGIPSKCYTYAVWYLTDVFKEHGIKPPKTWGEFLKVCQSFKEAGIHPIMAGKDETFDWFSNILARVGGPEVYEGLVNGSKSWKDPKVIKAYEMLRDISAKYFYPHPFGFNSPMAWVKLNMREAAMYLRGDWVNGMWQCEHHHTPGKEFDYFLLPPIDPKIGQVMVVGGDAWMLPKAARHPKEAREFIRYASSLESHKLLARNGMGILAHRNVPEKAYDVISSRLRNELAKYPTVHEMGAALNLKITSIEQAQRMKIVSNPNIKKEAIEDLMADIEMVAKEHRMLERLYSFREDFILQQFPG